MIPGLQNAEFLRFGQIHRNTYITRAALLTPTLQLRRAQRCSSPGRSRGEGYVESIATGLMAGLHASALAAGEAPRAFAARDRSGFALPLRLRRDAGRYQPANITFDCCRPRRSHASQSCVTTSKRATPKSAGGRLRPWRTTAAAMSELPARSNGTARELARGGRFAHTVAAYAADLRQFLEFHILSPEMEPPSRGPSMSHDPRVAGRAVSHETRGRQHPPQAGRGARAY